MPKKARRRIARSVFFSLLILIVTGLLFFVKTGLPLVNKLLCNLSHARQHTATDRPAD
ncbi:hypothetical protein [Spirosoma rhododendri]|uniref:Uncharacterized protein n=1 Tax=Spirosoma rhododendri TaxID=2728024 RepID=A0A7L5DRI3_9BACT|nr:hypothetical protein [Spirosoma rhododendri]QJD79843.1 hypothetical protein HH216_16525 [Spirosoma rhododendri]